MNLKKLFFSFTALLLILSLLFSGCNDKEIEMPSEFVPFIPETTAPRETDEKRKSYNVGTCYDMTDSICYLLIFLDDTESKWTENDKAEFIEKKFEPTLNSLSKKAEKYNVKLSDKYAEFEKENKAPVVFDEVIDADVVTNGSQDNVFTALATKMGYSSVKVMNESLKVTYDVEQIAYLIVLNKEGRSYKHSYVKSKREQFEFCVFFNKSIKLNGENCSSGIAHEILHLFGAEDYYDPYGKNPEKAQMAQKLYPDDIMMRVFKNIDDAQIGEYTAYSIGWTDTIPEECDTPEWWK